MTARDRGLLFCAWFVLSCSNGNLRDGVGIEAPDASAGRGGSGGGSPGSGGSSPPILGDAGGCSTPPPTGPLCTCNWLGCQPAAIACQCAGECYKQNADCLIVVGPNDVPMSANELLSTCDLSCTYTPAQVQKEFPIPAHLDCRATHCVPPLPPPPPAVDASRPPISDAGSPPVHDAGPPPVDVTPPPVDVAPPQPPGDPCPVPVPGPTIVKGPVWSITNVKFAVPFPDYAFATAHVARKLLELRDAHHMNLRPSPSFYFATALKESFLGCSKKLPPLDIAKQADVLMQREASFGDGCFQIESTTAFEELFRQFPEVFDKVKVTHAGVVSSMDQDTLGRDNFATSAFVKAYYDAIAYARLVNSPDNVPSPDAWFAAAADPLAQVKILALMYNLGLNTGVVATALGNCQKLPIESCVTTDYLVAVSSYTRDLEAAVAAKNCYNEPIARADVADYVAKITPLFVNEDAAALTTGATAAFDAVARGRDSVPFQEVAPSVLSSLDRNMKTKFYCPADQFAFWYNWQCPKQ